jgi:hypothetical protein
MMAGIAVACLSACGTGGYPAVGNNVMSAAAAGSAVAMSIATHIPKGTWMFAVSDGDLRSALDENASSATHVAVDIYNSDPTIAQLTPRANTFLTRPSLAQLQNASTGNNGSPAMLQYDIEHWTQTPASEQADPVGSIEKAATIAHGAGLKFGVSPDMNFMGWKYLGANEGCSFSMSAGIVPNIDWTNVDALNLQLERPANAACSPAEDFSQMVTVVTEIVAYVRSENPNAYITAGFSLAEEPPKTIIAAANAVRSSVNGFYVSYPGGGYCSAANLATTLAGL